MARYEFKLPDIGEGIAEAEIVAWHVKIGDIIGEDQQIADMMTDKATVEMESPVAGKVIALAGEVGDQVPIGSVLAVIETEGADRAAELSALVQERCFYHLEAPVERVTGWDTPYPHSYEWAYFPGPKRMKKALEKVMAD